GVDLVVEASGRVGFVNTNALLVGTKSVTRAVAATSSQDDERADGATSFVWDAAAIERFQPMSATAMSTLVTTAAASLKQGDVGALVKTSPVTLEVYRPSTKVVTLKKQLATTGARTSKLGAYPLVGPGNAFDLLVGGTGKLAFVNIQQRSYVAGTGVQVPTGSDAVARCRAALDQVGAGASQGVTLNATLVYFAPGLDTKVNIFEPGTDIGRNGADTVDMFWYTGHATAFGWQTDTAINDMRTMRLGDADLEWLVVAACGPLQETASTTSWRDRVASLFGGMHLLMGYASTSNDTAGEGRTFAQYSIYGYVPPVTTPRPALIAAWIFTAIDNQPSDVTWALAWVQSDNGGTLADCLNCGLADVVPSEAGFAVWRLGGAS
ncbi:MAG: DUF6345 domain-containing protein, partial [Ilumatobacteraceae bacterium]